MTPIFDKSYPLRTRVCEVLGIDPLTDDEGLMESITALRTKADALEAENMTMYGAIYEAARLHNNAAVRCQVELQRTAKNDAETKRNFRPTPAPSEYATAQIARVEQEKADERQGKK